MSSHYQKYKDTIKKCASNWLASRPEEYRENYLRPMIRKAVKKHYDCNREKILAYKKEQYQKKKLLKQQSVTDVSTDPQKIDSLLF